MADHMNWDAPPEDQKEVMVLDYGPPSPSPSPDPPEAQNSSPFPSASEAPMEDIQFPSPGDAIPVEKASQTDPPSTAEEATQTDTTSGSSETKISSVNNEDDNDGDACEEDGSHGEDVRAKSRLPDLVPDVERHFPSLLSGLTTGVPVPTFQETAARQDIKRKIVERIRERLRQKEPGPHFGRLHQVQNEIIPTLQTIRKPEWSTHPCRDWAQLGYAPEDLDEHGLIKAKPMPGPSDIVPAILVTAALTFPVNELHLNAHRSVNSLDQYSPCFTMALLGAMVSDFPWAKNFLATDTLPFAMHPGAKVPWHGPVTQTAFDLTFERILATDADLILLLAGSNRERFGIKFKDLLIARKAAIDLSEYLDAPSVGLKIGDRIRVVVFGPHPTACHNRQTDSPESKNVALNALKELTASLRAVHFVVTGEHAAARHIFDSAAWQIVASTWDEGSFRELLREEMFSLRRNAAGLEGVDEAKRLVPLAWRAFKKRFPWSRR